jgi:hypothetical protein
MMVFMFAYRNAGSLAQRGSSSGALRCSSIQKELAYSADSY